MPPHLASSGDRAARGGAPCSAEMHCEGNSCIDLTQPFTHDTLQWLLREHFVSLVVIAAYVLIKLMLRLLGRLVLGAAKCSTAADVSARVWDPACLLHNVVSIAVGLYTVVTWDGGGHHRRLLLKPAAAATADTCIGLSKPQAFTILLQAAHCLSDFVVFLPQMIGDPAIFFHHAVLLHGQSAPLSSASARLLCLPRACLAALGSSALSGSGRPTGRPATASGTRASHLQTRRCHRL